MTKKIICIICVFLLIFCFSSCNGNSDDMFTTEDGNSYIVCRDEKGNISINENDKLKVYTVNENGKKQKNDAGDYITEFIDFNGQVVIGNTVETAEMRYEIPDGFSSDENNSGYFYNEAIDAEIFFAFYGTDINAAIDAAEKNCETLLESYGSEVFEYQKYSVNIDDISCTAFKQRSVSSEYPDNSFLYYIPFDSGYYIVNCRVNTENENKINFDKFIKTIELK